MQVDGNTDLHGVLALGVVGLIAMGIMIRRGRDAALYVFISDVWESEWPMCFE